MPFNKDAIKNIVLGTIFAGSVLYTAYVHRDSQQRVEQTEKKISAVTENLANGQKHLSDKVNILTEKLRTVVEVNDEQDRGLLSLEELLNKQSENITALQYAADATVNVILLCGPADYGYGAGSVIYSAPKANKDGFDNYVVSVTHPFRDENNVFVTATTSTADFEFQIKRYKNSVPKMTVAAKVVAYDDARDVLILSFESVDKPVTVQLADEEDLLSIELRDEIYTVGCPLELPPVITDGRLQSKNIRLNTIEVWQVTPPVLNGNSGGGVYFKETNKLIGMMGAIATYSVTDEVSVVVPHLGFMIPFVGFREWLDKENLGFLYKKD